MLRNKKMKCFQEYTNKSSYQKGSLNLRLPFSMEMGDISFPIFQKMFDLIFSISLYDHKTDRTKRTGAKINFMNRCIKPPIYK